VNIRHRNLPIVLLIKETISRFLEVIGVRPETMSGATFGRMHFDQKMPLDWTIERPKSVLATALLELVRVSFKDLRAPDFKEDIYMQSEVNVGSLFENLDTPPMRKYRQEVLKISN